MKTCTKCHEMKEPSAFGWHGQNGGLRPNCRACRSVDRKAHYQLNRERVLVQCKAYGKVHVEEVNARSKAAYWADPAKRIAQTRAYQLNNPEKVKEWGRNGYANNKEKMNRQSRAWDRDNPERARIHAKNKCARRRQRIIQGGGSFSVDEWIELCNQYGNRCLACGKPELTVDHVIPLSKGGKNDISNIQPLCMSCNQTKHAKIIDYRSSLAFIK